MTSAPTQRAAPVLTPRFVLVVVVGLGYFLSIGSLLPVIPQYVEDGLGGGNVAVGVSVGAFFVGAVLLRPFTGRLGDRFGRRILIVGGALTAGAASGLYHLADAVPALVAVRVFAGIGEAAFFVGAGTMITDLAPVERRGEAISYWSVAVYSGLAFGPYLGEALLGDGQFGRVWTVSAALGLAAGFLALATRETMQPTEPDPGAHRQPLLHRAALAPGLILFLGLFALAGFVGFVPLYVTDVGLADSGGVFLLYGGLILAVRILGARIPDRLGPLRAGTGATGGIALGMAVLALAASPAGVYGGTVAFSIGMSLLYPSMMMLALIGVPETQRGSCVGTVSTFFDLSQGLGAVLLGGVASFAGLRGAFGVAALAAVVALVLLRSGIDPRARRRPSDEVAEVAWESLEPDA